MCFLYQVKNTRCAIWNSKLKRLHFHMKFFFMYRKILSEKYVNFLKHHAINNQYFHCRGQKQII